MAEMTMEVMIAVDTMRIRGISNNRTMEAVEAMMSISNKIIKVRVDENNGELQIFAKFST